MERSLSELPAVPAVYAMHGDNGRSYVGYVGVADELRSNVSQRLMSHDSSFATGPGEATLNPDHVRAVTWWEHPDFHERTHLEAAGVVAAEVLKPALRSRADITVAAAVILAERNFRVEMHTLFTGPPTGHLELPSLAQALDRITALENRFEALERYLADFGASG